MSASPRLPGGGGPRETAEQVLKALDAAVQRPDRENREALMEASQAGAVPLARAYLEALGKLGEAERALEAYADRGNWYEDSAEGDSWEPISRGWEPAQKALEAIRSARPEGSGA